MDKICPSCNRLYESKRNRVAEISPHKLTEARRLWRQWQIIGITYTHSDGTFCDMSIYHLEKLRSPAFLKLGDDTIDPRV